MKIIPAGSIATLALLCGLAAAQNAAPSNANNTPQQTPPNAASVPTAAPGTASSAPRIAPGRSAPAPPRSKPRPAVPAHAREFSARGAAVVGTAMASR